MITHQARLLMPVYHFGIRSNTESASSDWTATELPDLASAEREAVRFAGEVIAEHAILGRHIAGWGLDVTDHAGTSLFKLDFAVQRLAGTDASQTPQLLDEQLSRAAA